jgi:DNA-binding transcriptional regulator YdaS (Cro superfamily)
MKVLAIERAVKKVGGQARLAEKVGVSQPTVWKWLHGKLKPSPEYVPGIVSATNGEVLPNEIRPDLPTLFPPEDNSSVIAITTTAEGV